MAVVPVGALPAVLVNQAAVDFAVLRARPESDALFVVVQHHVDELAAAAGSNFEPSPGPREIVGVRALLLGFPDGLGDQDLNLPDPDVGGGVDDLQASVDRGAFARGGADVDRFFGRAGQAHLVAHGAVFAVGVAVGAAPQPDGFARRRLARERGRKVERALFGAVAQGRAVGRGENVGEKTKH